MKSIYPGDTEQVQYWTRRWRITTEQLNEAIIETGSINPIRIKKYLITEGIIFSFFGVMKHAKQLFISNHK